VSILSYFISNYINNIFRFFTDYYIDYHLNNFSKNTYTSKTALPLKCPSCKPASSAPKSRFSRMFARLTVAMALPFLCNVEALATTSAPTSNSPLVAAIAAKTKTKGARANSLPNFVYAHYMHAYILGDYVGSAPTNPDNLANWPTAEMNPRSWWPSSLNAIAKAGKSSESIDLSLGQQAGIDAFALLVSPTNVQPISAYLPGMQHLAAAASTSKVKLIPDIWFSVDTSTACTFRNPCDGPSWAAFGQNVKNLMTGSSNAFLTVNGKYVISVSSVLYENYVTASGFQHFFDPWQGASNFIVIECSGPFTSQNDYAASGWANAEQAVSMWTGDAGWNDTQYTALPLEATYNSTPQSWPIHSSYFGFRPGAYNQKENFGVANMIQQWRNAVAHKTQFAEVQTWNDFTEDHAITQTNTRGSTLIHLTRYFSDWFTSGTQPTITKDRAFVFYQRQLVGAKLTNATVVAAPPSLSESQMVDYLNVVTMLTAPGVVTLTDGGLNIPFNAPAGLHQWLVYAPSTRSRYNYPTATSSLDVNVVSSIPAGVPSVQVTRGKRVIATTTGLIPIAATALWQDLSMIGAESADTNPSAPY
jgi:hypothetical protein